LLLEAAAVDIAKDHMVVLVVAVQAD